MLSILTTGGTFDKVYFDANSAFSVGDPQVIPLLNDANIDIEYDVTSILKKDSLDMDDEDRQRVVDAVMATKSTQIIITHGTDGMVSTAKALSQADLGDKVIVMVGAMQPARMRTTDAPFNLGFAVASVQLLKPGIYITMNGRVFPFDKVRKNLAAGRFEAVL